MALKDISSREAVLKAIAEFDILKRGAFLEKYGFAESRDVFIVHEANRYDSKPVLAAAHQFQFGEPLDRFHGGPPPRA